MELRKLKEEESYLKAELYRILKDAIGSGFSVEPYKFIAVLPEVPVDDEKADLVVFTDMGVPKPFLIIETKRRTFDKPGVSLANAVKKTREVYVKKLEGRFYAVWDGWIMLIFKEAYPFLVDACNAEVGDLTAEFGRTLLEGLADMSYRGDAKRLSQLPRIRDPAFVRRKIFPSVAKYFAQEWLRSTTREVSTQNIEDEKGRLINQWDKKTL